MTSRSALPRVFVIAMLACFFARAAYAQSDPPSIVTPPQNITALQGDTVTFSATLAGAQPITYLWRNPAGIGIGSGPASSVTLSNVQLSDAGTYSVYASNSFGSLTASAVLTVVGPEPAITVAPVAQTVTIGTKVWLSVQASGGLPFSYQWLRNGVPVSGATAQALVIENAQLSDNASFTVQVSNAFGGISSQPVTLTVTSPAAFAGGSGTAADPYRIATIAQLDAVHNNLGAHFVLTANLDLAGVAFNPIGTSTRPFSGTFDGGSFSVSNWTFAVPSVPFSFTAAGQPATSDYIGLFSASSGTISNLSLVSAQVTGQRNTGALVGSNNGTINLCSTTGTVTGLAQTGGLVGLSGGRIVGCSSTADVAGDSYIGGFVGENDNYILDCQATGNIRAGIYSGGDNGGFVGHNTGTIQRSHATGNVVGVASIGGFVGANFFGPINACYATGAVSAPSGGAVGGFVGFNYFSSPISNSYATGSVNAGDLAGGFAGSDYCVLSYCYSTGLVSGGSDTGGLLGYSISPPPVFTSCFWDTQTSNQATSLAGTGKTTAEMQQAGTFVGWDFANNWTIAANQYPTLRSNAALFPEILSVAPGDQFVYRNDPVTFTVVMGGSGSFSYQWRFHGQSTNGAPQDISGATNPSLIFASAQPADSGYYSVLVSTAAGSVASPFVYLGVSDQVAPPTIVTQPTEQIVSLGDTATFSVTATATEAPTYQWYLDGVPIGGATGSSITISPVGVADLGGYSVTVVNSGGSVYSNVAELLLLAPPAVTSLSPSSATAGGRGFNLTVAGASFFSGAVIKWNGSARATTFVDHSTLTASILASDLVSSTDVSAALVTVQNPNGDTSPAVALPIITANVSAVQSGATAPASSVTVTTTAAGGGGVTSTLQNNSTTATSTVSVANYATNPTTVPTIDVGGKFVDVQVLGADASDTATTSFYYPASITGTPETALTLVYFDGSAWQSVLSSGGTAPAKDTTDNLDGTASGGRFTVVFDNTSTPQITQLTGTFFGVTITATTPPVIHSITASPFLLTPANHKMIPVVLTVNATDNVDPHPTSRIVSVTSNEPVIGPGSGNTTPDWEITGALTLNLRAERAAGGNGRVYTITVETKDTSGNKTTGSTTVVVPKDENAAKHAPDIIADPKDQRVASGADVTFSVSVAPALPVTYQWRFNGKAIAGATAVTLALHGVTSTNAGDYSVAVTNANGTTVSNAGELTVVPHAPVITAAPQSQTVTSGANVTFSVAAASDVPPTYQWLFKGKMIEGAKSSALTLTKVELSDAGSYSVVVRNAGGSTTSAVATLTVQAPAIASLSPATVTAGTAAFTLTVNGSGFANGATVRWNGAERTTKFINSGSLTASISAGDIDAAKTVSITVRSPSGDVSNVKTLTIVLPHAPVITTTPKSQTIGSGGNVTFSVTATSAVPPTYQWLFKGKAIGGAKSATLTLTKVALSDAGSYSVQVINDGGLVTSSAAILIVQPPAIASLSPSTVLAGSAAFTLTVTGSGFVAGDVVRWNGDERTTTFVSATVLTAAVRASDLPSSKSTTSASVTVRSASGDVSNAKTVIVTANR